jgi:hypothetical protein
MKDQRRGKAAAFYILYTGSPGGKPPYKTLWDKIMEETGTVLKINKRNIIKNA